MHAILERRINRSMTTPKRNKLNALYTRLEPGAPLMSEDLSALGISADLAVHYVRAGWLTRLARGVYCRPNDTLALGPCLVLLERRFTGLHAGAKRRSIGMACASTSPSSQCCTCMAGSPVSCPLGLLIASLRSITGSGCLMSGLTRCGR